MVYDPEITALNEVYESLKGLNHGGIQRVVSWVNSKFRLNQETGLEVVQPGFIETAPTAAAEPVEPPVQPVKKRRGRPPAKPGATGEKTLPQPVSNGIRGFMKYESLEEVFYAANARTIVAKILLAAAFLQENKSFKELSSYDVSSSLKKIGQPINNASIGINSLMSRKPPLLIQTGTFGDSKQSRRKFRVTEEGFRIARNYIK